MCDLSLAVQPPTPFNLVPGEYGQDWHHQLQHCTQVSIKVLGGGMLQKMNDKVCAREPKTTAVTLPQQKNIAPQPPGVHQQQYFHGK